jgi:hypothetical protein
MSGGVQRNEDVALGLCHFPIAENATLSQKHCGENQLVVYRKALSVGALGMVSMPAHTDHKEALLKRAFQLAWFLHGDRALATEIAMGAYEKLEVAATAQDKRLYYQAGKRADTFGSSSSRPRNKVNLSELHLLQRLTMLESDPHEQQKESSLKNLPAPPSLPRLNTILTTHYLKQLAQLTLNRNAFYTTLGFSRLLYNFSTTETMEIYGAVAQDSGPGPDDYYYRSRKALLLGELNDRFGDMLKVRRGQRGEERFEAQPDSTKFVELIQDCLHHFAPWNVACSVPEGFDAERHELPSLSYDNRNSADVDSHWHKVELARMHAVMNPECYDRLVTGLGMAKPVTRLELPRFFLSQSADEPEDPTYHDQGPDRRDDDNDEPPQLNSGDFQSMLRELAARAGRRRFTAARLLRVMVNGREAARLDLTQAAQTSLTLNHSAQLVEVRSIAAQDGPQGETLLAVFVPEMNSDDAFAPLHYAITLEGGQRIQFHLTPASSDDSLQPRADLQIHYRETQWTRAFALWRTRVAAGSSAAWLPVPKLAFALLFVLLAGLAAYWVARPAPQYIVKQGGELTPSPSVMNSPAPQPTASATPRTVATPLISDDVIATDLRTRAGDETASLTRGERADAVTLLAARKVYLEMQAGESLRSQLIERLAADRLFTITSNQDEADIALKVNASFSAPNRLTLIARIVDTNGKVIWPLTPRVSGRKYQGPTDKVITAFSRELANDLR